MKKYFIIPMMFLFLECSIIAKSVENGKLTPSVWYGYYNYNEVPDFNNLSFNQFYIKENFINIKSGNFSTTTGEPIQSSAGSYKVTKILKNTPEEYQVLITDALANIPAYRTFGLKKVNSDVFVSEPVLWEEGMNTRTLNYKSYLYSETYVDLVAVSPSALTPDSTILFNTFLEKMTAGKDSDVWLITPVAVKIAGSITLGMVGMSEGSEITIFKECVKNPDGSPKVENGQKIWGYAHGKTIGFRPKPHDYPLYYKPIPVADRYNKYGIYWFQGNGLFGNRPIEIPLMIHESKGINRVYSGSVKGLTDAITEWDPDAHWLYLERNSLDGILKHNYILERKIPVVTL